MGGGWAVSQPAGGVCIFVRTRVMRQHSMYLSKNSDNGFAFRIAALNACGFCITVVAITFTDARIPSHVRYGARVYEYGYAVALLAVPVFLATCLLLRRPMRRSWKCFVSCAPLLAAVLGSVWAFKPEIPHAGFATVETLYVLASLVATWLRYSVPDLAFVSNCDIPTSARLEGLKSILGIWQAIAVVTIVGFLGGLVPWGTAITSTNSNMVTQKSDLFLLNAMIISQMIPCSVAFLLGPIREAAAKVLSISAAFANIREPPTRETGSHKTPSPQDMSGE